MAEHSGAAGAGGDRRDRFDVLAEVLTSGILMADAEGSVDYANPAARELFWLSDQQIFGRGWLEAIDPEDRRVVEAAVARLGEAVRSEAIDFKLPLYGELRWVRGRFNAIAQPGEACRGWIAVLEDITVDREASVHLAHRATHDALTGLANRELFEDRLGQARARSQRRAAPLAVCFLDLDGFKAINDQHGHRVGDLLLRAVADRLTSSIRAEDTAARIGGDEFVILLEGVPQPDLPHIVDRLIASVARPLELDGLVLTPQASLGVRWSPLALEAAELMVRRADEAMYQAKQVGHPVIDDGNDELPELELPEKP